MDENKRDLANQLMATLTALLEQSHLVASTGHSTTATCLELADYGEQLKSLTDNISVMAQAVVIVSRCAIDRPQEKT